MGALIGLMSSFIGLLIAAAIVSRLARDKNLPGIIGKGTDAMTNIFRGVFHG